MAQECQHFTQSCKVCQQRQRKKYLQRPWAVVSQLLLIEERVGVSIPTAAFLLLVKQPVDDVQPVWGDHVPQPRHGFNNAETLHVQLLRRLHFPQLGGSTKKKWDMVIQSYSSQQTLMTHNQNGGVFHYFVHCPVLCHDHQNWYKWVKFVRSYCHA